MQKTHAAEDVRRLAELDVVIAHDLDPVSPRIQKIKETPGQDLDAGRDQSRAQCLLVVHHQPEVAPVVGCLPASPLQGDELIPKIDERGIFALAAQLEVKQASIERERFLDITDFERDVVYTDGARLLVLRHDRPPVKARLHWRRYGPTGHAAQSHQGIVTRPIAVIALDERVAQRLQTRGGAGLQPGSRRCCNSPVAVLIALPRAWPSPGRSAGNEGRSCAPSGIAVTAPSLIDGAPQA